MGGFSPIHWVLLIGVAVVLFGGAGRLSGLMGDAAKGIRAFREGLKNEDETPVDPAAATNVTPTPAAPQPLPQPAPAPENQIVR
jgi:sec-independent protein translocase protein TatA